MIHEERISIIECHSATYPDDPPFHPSETYPEFEGSQISSRPNEVYAAVRRTLLQLDMDNDRQGRADWNPLSELIKPGDTVLLKPNLVLHFNSSGQDRLAVVTHGSVVRPVLDYVIRALDGEGEIIVGDAPHGNADFDEIIEFTGLRQVVEYCRGYGIPISLVDFRQYRYGHGEEGFLKETRTQLEGDPRGYTVVDVGPESELESLPHIERLYGADYDRSIIVGHHAAKRHEYLISNSVLEADVVISLPKLKVHSKAGVTINLKNLVGINGDKNWLPHYRIGHQDMGGDEFPRSSSILENVMRSADRKLSDLLLPRDNRIGKLAYRLFLKGYYPLISFLTKRSRNEIHRGNWSGNDTVWRMVLDLNKILLYSRKDGILTKKIQRRFLSIVDGIIAGEGNGPLGPTPRTCGIVLGGYLPLSVDVVGARLMGISHTQLPLLREGMKDRIHKLGTDDPMNLHVVSSNPSYELVASKEDTYLGFTLPYGWSSSVQPPDDPATMADEVSLRTSHEAHD